MARGCIQGSRVKWRSSGGQFLSELSSPGGQSSSKTGRTKKGRVIANQIDNSFCSSALRAFSLWNLDFSFLVAFSRRLRRRTFPLVSGENREAAAQRQRSKWLHNRIQIIFLCSRVPADRRGPVQSQLPPENTARKPISLLSRYE